MRLGLVSATCLLFLVILAVSGCGDTDTKASAPSSAESDVASAQPCPVSPVDESVDWESANIFGGSGIGPGPVYPGLGSDGGLFSTDGDRSNGFYSGKLFWYVDPSYLGSVLIRGRRIDRRGPLRFNRVDKRELRIGPSKTVEWEGQPAGSRGVPSGVLIRAAGCYEVQINGTDFSYTVVFWASTS
ncbi:MAG: hypothetical protein M3355_02335 [Actinomycetota bacterium]|nr:hypothetical protein [Actinomycetota bacterium]